MASVISTARANLEYARSLPYPPGWSNDYGRWREITDEMYADIPSLTTPIEVLRYAQAGKYFDHRVKSVDSLWSTLWCNLIETEFPWFIEDVLTMSDDPDSRPETIGTIGKFDLLVSNIYFWHLRSILNICTYVGKPYVVLEIGGGYGAFARLFCMGSLSPAKYFIVDIPESLFFAECCLTKSFPGEVGYWRGEDPGTKFVLVPIQNLDTFCVGADVVINIGSMQEMSEHWVGAFMGWLDLLPTRHFYSLNYACQPLAKMGESRNYWAPRPGQLWVSKILNFDPVLTRTMTANRGWLEALYERGAQPPRTMESWAVNRGFSLTRQTYLEGLDLLRVNWSKENAEAFLMTLNNTPYLSLKESYFVAKSFEKEGEIFSELCKTLEGLTGGYER